jgi:hypothetical protein
LRRAELPGHHAVADQTAGAWQAQGEAEGGSEKQKAGQEENHAEKKERIAAALTA